MRPEPEIMLAAADERINFILHHPDMSDWLKQALQTAVGRDPVALQNDIEMLSHLLTPRIQAQIEMAIGAALAQIDAP